MKHNVIPAFEFLLTPIEQISFLPGNPHEGDVQAMKASLEALGQHRAVIARRTGESSGIAVVGNHMLEAALELGWTHIAVAFVDDDEQMSLARAVMDNKVAERGKDDPDKLAMMLPQVIDFDPQMFAVVGWDDFAVAEMEMTHQVIDAPSGYTAPQLVTPPTDQGGGLEDESDDLDLPPRPGIEGISQEDLIKTGAGNTDEKRDVVIQYTLVFSSSEQQRRWREFVKWLREDPGTDGETTVDKLMDFLEQRADF